MDMNLRCKPGDLARVIRANDPRNLNMILLVLELEPDANEPTWRVSGWYHGCMANPEERYALDAQLEPLKKPGEDEKDESVRWLPPVPTKHLEKA